MRIFPAHDLSSASNGLDADFRPNKHRSALCTAGKGQIRGETDSVQTCRYMDVQTSRGSSSLPSWAALYTCAYKGGGFLAQFSRRRKLSLNLSLTRHQACMFLSPHRPARY